MRLLSQSKAGNVTTLREEPRKRWVPTVRNVTTLFAVVTILAGCQSASGTFCAIAKPIHLTPQTVDAMTDAEVAAVLAHDERGERLCGWNR